MLRSAFLLAMACILFVVSPQFAPAQASKKLEGKSVVTTPQSSWDQVDKINREADGTRARNDQARRAGGLDKKGYTGGKIKASSIFPKTPKMKGVPKKQVPLPKK